MKPYERMEVQLYAFLTSALDGCKWSDSRPGHFNPGEKRYPLDRGLVGLRVGLAAVTRKYPSLCQESNLGRPTHSLAAELTELPRLPLLSLTHYEPVLR
jgi:hypothetical protein